MREVVQRQLTLEFPISERLIVSEVSCYAQLLCLKLRHYYQTNQSALLERANDCATLTPQKQRIQAYHADQIRLSTAEHSDAYNQLRMPMGLVLVIAKSLGIKESDIRMTLAGNMFHVEFPNEKLIIPRMGTEKLTLDARLMLDMGLDESLSGQRITMQTLRILHKNMYQHGMGLDIIPMFGVSQSGKSSLLNFLFGSDITRVCSFNKIG